MKSLKPIIITVLVLTLILIGASILTNRALYSSAQKLDGYITNLEKHTVSGDWTKAKEQLNVFEENWNRTEKIWSMLLDHIEIDNIDMALSRMSKFVETQNTPLALGEAAVLKHFIKHIPEKESFKLANLF
ncbi:MAG: DUF4363 family protein [Clostridia bacterium]|nr:DUF4363 family protein [Clostridia bacterium]